MTIEINDCVEGMVTVHCRSCEAPNTVELYGDEEIDGDMVSLIDGFQCEECHRRHLPDTWVRMEPIQ